MSDFEFDEVFWSQFCPVCGSDDTKGHGFQDKLVDKKGWDEHCNNCGWDYLVVLVERGKQKFKFRHDKSDCGVCKKEMKRRIEG